MKILLPFCCALCLLSFLWQTTECRAEEPSAFAKGIALRIEQKNRRAITAFRNVLPASPNHIGALVQMGAAFEDLGKWKEAEKWYRRAIAIDPVSGSARRNLRQMIASLRMNSAGNVPAPSQQRLTRRGLRALERRDFDTAFRTFQLLCGLFPDDPRFMLYLAVTHERSGERDKAIAMYRRTTEIFPNFPPSRVNLIVALIKAGDRKSATREARSALESIPDEPRIRYLARVLGTAITLSNDIGASKAPVSARQP